MKFFSSLGFIAATAISSSLVSAETAGTGTYHMYNAGDSLGTVACSDGATGLMNWGYSDISALYPYVTAFKDATWNSPNCGKCLRVTSDRGVTVYLTVIDQRGPQHTLDIAPPAFQELFGAAGNQAGQGSFTWDYTNPSNCKGNKFGGGSGGNSDGFNNVSNKGAPVNRPQPSSTSVVPSSSSSATPSTSVVPSSSSSATPSTSVVPSSSSSATPSTSVVPSSSPSATPSTSVVPSSSSSATPSTSVVPSSSSSATPSTSVVPSSSTSSTAPTSTVAPPSCDSDSESGSESEPVVEDIQPVVSDSEPVVEDIQSVASDSEPVVEDNQSVAGDSEPVVEDIQPVAGDSEPVVEDIQPVAGDSEPFVEESEPVSNERQSVVTEDIEPVGGDFEECDGNDCSAQPGDEDDNTYYYINDSDAYPIYDPENVYGKKPVDEQPVYGPVDTNKESPVFTVDSTEQVDRSSSTLDSTASSTSASVKNIVSVVALFASSVVSLLLV